MICSKYAGTAAQQQVYWYHRDNSGEWVLDQTVSASELPNSADNDSFGIGVAICGNDAIIGNIVNAGNGRVHFYRKGNDGTWSLKQTVTGESGQFGLTVWMSKNYAVVGNTNDTRGGAAAGSVDVYLKGDDGNWARQQTILGLPGDNLGGWNIRVNDNYILACAPNRSSPDGTAQVGTVLLYKRKNDGTWELEQTLQLSNQANAGTNANGSIDLSDNYILTGLSGFTAVAGTEGRTQFHMRKNDGDVSALATFDGDTAADQFGGRSAMYGNYAAIIADGVNPCELTFYKRDREGNWEQDGSTTTPDNAQSLGSFDGINMHGNYLAVTSPNAGTTGQVLIFNRKY